MQGDNYYQLIFIVLIYIIGAIINRVMKGKQDRAMKELGSALSLEYIEGSLVHPPRLAGTYQSREVTVENVSHSHGREQKPFFRVVMRTSIPIPDSIRVHTSLSFGPVTGLFTEIGEFFGVHDIHFDNSVFDEKFLVRGRNELLVKAVLDAEVQEALLSIGRVNLVVQHDEIIYEDEGTAPENESRIRMILSFEDIIATQVTSVAAKGYSEEGGVPEPIEGFKPKPQATQPQPTGYNPLPIGFPQPGMPQPGTGQAPPRAQPQVTVDMGHNKVYRVGHSDVVALRSDYAPQKVTADSLINQLKSEGYYSGD